MVEGLSEPPGKSDYGGYTGRADEGHDPGLISHRGVGVTAQNDTKSIW